MKGINYDIADKVFVVTGGTRGIGLYISKLLISQNAKVVICGRKPENIESALSELNSGDRLVGVKAHIAKSEDVDNLFDTALKTFGRVDALINNVGMNIVTGLVDADKGLWEKIIGSNLTGTFLCSRKAGQIMRDQKQGKIVSLSSIAGHRASIAMGIYGIAKAGIEMMTKVLAQELAGFNVQVNAVAPFMVRTGFSRPFWSDEKVYKMIVNSVPMGRIAEPADVAHPVLFLCSSGANFITGHTLKVDGGVSAV